MGYCAVRLFALLIDVFFIDDMCVFFIFSLFLVSLALYVDIYIVKRRHPCFVGGAIEILLIDWLKKLWQYVKLFPHSTEILKRDGQMDRQNSNINIARHHCWADMQQIQVLS